MKKLGYKIKVILTTLWVALISFSSKVISFVMETGDVLKIKTRQTYYDDSIQQTLYGVPNTSIRHMNPILNTINWILAAVILIIGIVSLIRIIRTNDKNLKKKRIKNTIIVIAILIMLIIALFIFSPSLIEYFSCL